jgi:DNA anti-recombination protein RmuC
LVVARFFGAVWTRSTPCYNQAMAGDFESRMQFIIEQQAQFTADMHALKERQAEGQRQIEENRGRIRQLLDVTMSLARHGEETDRLFKETDRRIREMAEETDRRIKEQREAGAHTDRRLDALIDIVDKLTRRNGGAQ